MNRRFLEDLIILWILTCLLWLALVVRGHGAPAPQPQPPSLALETGAWDLRIAMLDGRGAVETVSYSAACTLRKRKYRGVYGSGQSVWGGPYSYHGDSLLVRERSGSSRTWVWGVKLKAVPGGWDGEGHYFHPGEDPTSIKVTFRRPKK